MRWDHGTHPDFYKYYARESESEAAAQRFRGIRKCLSFPGV